MTGAGEEPFKILIADDEANTADAIKLALEKALNNISVTIETDFEKAISLIRPLSFDCVILDLFEGAIGDQLRSGESVWQLIINETFLPVIIYTAGECELEPAFPDDNPILKCITKSRAGLRELVDHVASICPYMVELRDIFRDFHEILKFVLIETTPYLWRGHTPDQNRSKLLLRSIRRRVAALMDEKSLTTTTKPFYWEQYLIPPLGDSLLTGDILFKVGSDRNDPSNYRVILTPSCDLQENDGRTKVDKVLVSICKPAGEYLKACKIEIPEKPSKEKMEKVRKKLEMSLTYPQMNGYVFFPKYGTFIPSMVGSLKDLNLISLEKISKRGSDEGKEYIRIASIDSPFREQIAWAYLQVSGRVGVPDRDLNQCITENFDTLIN